jgi:hypothetical protein
MGCHDRLPRMGTGMANRVGWDAGLHSSCVGRRHGKVGPNGGCLRSGDEHGMCIGRGACNTPVSRNAFAWQSYCMAFHVIIIMCDNAII